MAKKEDEIPEETVNQMMGKCGRRCCICRRYRPTKLQVHHIHERSKGGTHDEDNLIVTCFSCHSDVHTHVPFARRFTQAELKLHRDTLIKQVADGVFPATDSDDTDEVVRRVLEALCANNSPQPQLGRYATEILLCAVDAPGQHQGRMMLTKTFKGTWLQVNQKNLIAEPQNERLIAGYEHGLLQLVRCGLATRASSSLYQITYEGYLLADDLKVRGEGAFSD